MTDQALRRVDELLTELVETIETARAVPMSSSCVIPREHVLDLLDELRDVLPPEMDEARKLVARKAEVVGESQDYAAELRATADREVEAYRAEARARIEQDLTEASAEQARLLAQTSVVAAAEAEAARVRSEAQAEAASTREQALAQADAVRVDAQRYSDHLRTDAEDYAERTLGELIEHLHRTATTAQQGQRALRERMETARDE